MNIIIMVKTVVFTFKLFINKLQHKDVHNVDILCLGRCVINNFANSGCVNSWAEVQADDLHFICRGCKTVKCLQEQVNELRHNL